MRARLALTFVRSFAAQVRSCVESAGRVGGGKRAPRIVGGEDAFALGGACSKTRYLSFPVPPSRWLMSGGEAGDAR